MIRSLSRPHYSIGRVFPASAQYPSLIEGADTMAALRFFSTQTLTITRICRVVPVLLIALIMVLSMDAQTVTATINTGTSPAAIAINPVTNKVYVANYDGATVTVIDEINNNTATVNVGTQPDAIAVNSVTNKI